MITCHDSTLVLVEMSKLFEKPVCHDFHTGREVKVAYNNFDTGAIGAAMDALNESQNQ